MNSQPEVWMVGDLQGCYQSLIDLLSHPEVSRDPDAVFWFAGDLVNRGPDSLATLKAVMALGDRAITVLGNHDLNLLAVAAGVRKQSKSDTLDDILDARDAQEMLDWLRHCPLAHFEHNHLLVHAGVLPKWSVEKTMQLASEVEAGLRGPNWKLLLSKMYGNEPVHWKDEYEGSKRLRVVINALTRMRMCDSHGHMEFTHKDAPINNGRIMPWFDVPGRAIKNETIVFGHWSTLGLMIRPDVICLDSGCVWGRQLTAMRLQDRKVVQVPCRKYSSPHQY